MSRDLLAGGRILRTQVLLCLLFQLALPGAADTSTFISLCKADPSCATWYRTYQFHAIGNEMYQLEWCLRWVQTTTVRLEVEQDQLVSVVRRFAAVFIGPQGA